MFKTIITKTAIGFLYTLGKIKMTAGPNGLEFHLDLDGDEIEELKSKMELEKAIG